MKGPRSIGDCIGIGCVIVIALMVWAFFQQYP